MRYFLTFVIKAAFISSVFGASQDNSSSENDIEPNLNIWRTMIAENLEIFEALSDDYGLTKTILKSIDQNCMLEKYQKHNLISDLSDAALDLDWIGSENKTIDPFIVFANIALSCSSKLDSVLKFAFSLAFSFSELFDGFLEGEPFNKIVDELACFNNHAVKMEYLDPTVYPRLLDLPKSITEDECAKLVEDNRHGIYEIIKWSSEYIVSDHRRCLKNEIVEAAEKLFSKYILLIPLGLTDKQKFIEKKNFVKDTREVLEKLLVCNRFEDVELRVSEYSEKFLKMQYL